MSRETLWAEFMPQKKPATGILRLFILKSGGIHAKTEHFHSDDADESMIFEANANLTILYEIPSDRPTDTGRDL
jgi:hypothetical protein